MKYAPIFIAALALNGCQYVDERSPQEQCEYALGTSSRIQNGCGVIKDSLIKQECQKKAQDGISKLMSACRTQVQGKIIICNCDNYEACTCQ